YALHHLSRRLWAWRHEYATPGEWAGEVGDAAAASQEVADRGRSRRRRSWIGLNVTVGNNGVNGQIDPNGANGVVSLGGTLNVSVDAGSVLTNLFNHVIVDGPYTGTFDTENIANDGQLVTRVRYETNQVVLRTRCLADTNLDGSVDPADFNAWVNAFNNSDTVADQNLDGLITPADFNSWVLNFNSGC
ncbi:MAG: GC-type dockerin domain-anchored protein, partial [Planctomycetota bacterium]